MVRSFSPVYPFQLFIFLFLTDPKVVFRDMLRRFLFFGTILKSVEQRNARSKKVFIEVSQAGSLLTFRKGLGSKDIVFLESWVNGELLIIELDLLLLNDLNLLLESFEAIL